MPQQGLQEGSVIRLPGVSHVSGAARRPLGLRDLPLPADRLDDLLFLMNELVTNSFFHIGDSTVNIEVRVLEEAIRVEVRSERKTASAGEVAGPTPSPGWGFAWLNESADRWGSEQGAACVWFEIDRERPVSVPI
jgi:anti-sigma regulatory factor (Ser/Thr protein kinase)